jgi:hypothetical protein
LATVEKNSSAILAKSDWEWHVQTMTNPIKKTIPSDESLFEESYKRLLPELGRLSPDDIQDVNIDTVTAVATVFGALLRLSIYRDYIAKEIPDFDIARFD